MKIKVIDPKGYEVEIEEKLWNNLLKMKNNRYRLADPPAPKEVVEFLPTIEAFVEEKKQEIEEPVEPVVFKEPVKEPVKKQAKKPVRRGKK